MTQRAATRPVVVAEFGGHRREWSWHRAYIDACASVEQVRPVQVLDVADVGEELLAQGVALFVRALRSSEVTRRAVVVQLKRDCARQASDRRLALGISPVGERHDEAADHIVELLESHEDALPWIDGAATAEDLQELISKWLLMVIDRRFRNVATVRSAAIRGEEILAAELPNAADAAATTDARTFRSLR